MMRSDHVQRAAISSRPNTFRPHPPLMDSMAVESSNETHPEQSMTGGSADSPSALTPPLYPTRPVYRSTSCHIAEPAVSSCEAFSISNVTDADKPRTSLTRHRLLGGLGQEARARESFPLGVTIDLIEHVGRHRHVDTNALHVRRRRCDENGDPLPVLRVLHDFLQRTRLRRGFAILGQPLQMEGQRFRRHIAGLIQGFSGADDAGKIGKGNAVVAVGVLVDQGNILSHVSFILCCWQGGPLALL